jgi:hypothetical protein
VTDPVDLQPARREHPDPEEGWRGADLTDTELVDDEFIAADPGSVVVTDEDI